MEGSDSNSDATANVRTKVRFWVNGFVNDLRKKSPATIQKWVDSIPQISSNNIFTSAARTDTDEDEEPAAITDSSGPIIATEETQINTIIRNQSDTHTSGDRDIPNKLNDFVLNGTGDCVETTTQLVDDCDDIDVDVNKISGDSEDENVNDINYSKLNEIKQFDIDNKVNIIVPIDCENTNKKRNFKTEYLNKSKLKINEFYAKLSLNRERYNILKTRKMDIKKILLKRGGGDDNDRDIGTSDCDGNDVGGDKENFNKENNKQINDNNGINLICDNMKNSNFNENINDNINNNDNSNDDDNDDKSDINSSYNSNCVKLNDIPTRNNQFEFSFDDTFSNKDDNVSNYSHDDEFRLSDYQNDNANYLNINMNTPGNTKKTNQRVGIGDIGRSASENPSTSKKLCLNDIGRSFSEAEVLANDDDQYVDDDDDNLSVDVNIYLNEFNNSYPMSSSMNTSSSINYSNSNLMLRAKSVPVRPIPSHLFNSNSSDIKKLIMSRDSSMQSTDSSKRRYPLLRDNSQQSDSSHCSSVESLLEARKPDPEAILVNLGLGPERSENLLTRLPKRFLKPSQVRGIDTESFIQQQQMASSLHENSVLGYRGLMGNPHILPSTIVAKIMQRFQSNEETRIQTHPDCDLEEERPLSAPPGPRV